MVSIHNLSISTYYILFISVIFLVLLTISLKRIIKVITLSHRVHNDVMRVYSRVRDLTISEAQNIAYKLLENNRYFSLYNNSSTNIQLSILPKYLQSLFQKYSKINSLIGELELNGNIIMKWEYDPCFIVIGHCSEFISILVHSDRETIYALDGTEQTQQEIDANSFTSIFHYIVFYVISVFPEEFTQIS